MKFIKDLSRCTISSKISADIVILDENFIDSSKEYALCKVVVGSKNSLVLYNEAGKAVKVLNDNLDDLSDYDLIFIETPDKWYNIRIGINDYIESSRPYNSYKEALDNRMPSDTTTISIPRSSMIKVNRRKYSTSVTSDIEVLRKYFTAYDDSLLKAVKYSHNYVIPNNPVDENLVNEMIAEGMTDILRDYKLELRDLTLAYSNNEEAKRIYLGFISAYPSLRKYINDDNFTDKYIELVYG